MEISFSIWTKGGRLASTSSRFLERMVVCRVLTVPVGRRTSFSVKNLG